MVSRFVQKKEVVAGQHQLQQEKAGALAAAEQGDRTENILAAKEKGSQRIAQLGLGQGGITVPNGFDHGFAIVQAGLGLVIISNGHLCPEPHRTMQGRKLTMDDLQHRGFAAAIWPEQKNTLTAPDGKRGISEQLSAPEAHGQPFCIQHLVTARYSSAEIKMNRLLHRFRGFQLRLHAFEHLFLAFGGPNALFPVELLELCNAVLHMLNIPHGGFIMLFGNLLVVRARFFVLRVIAVCHIKPSMVQFDCAVGNAVEKITVMGDDNGSSGIGPKEFLKPFHRSDIQVVGWLIQQQYVGIREQQTPHSGLGTLTAAQGGNRLGKGRFVKSQADQR